MKIIAIMLLVASVPLVSQPRFKTDAATPPRGIERISATRMEDAFAKPESVVRLDLSRSTTSVPDNLASLPNLRELRLVGCKLESLPTSLQACTNLEVVDISYNNFTEIPAVLSALPNLREIHVSGNPIVTSGGFTGSRSVEVVYLDECSLTELPAFLGGCAELKEVYASRNSIRSVPSNLQGCTKLKKLVLARNAITSVPTWLESMPELAVLDLSGNQITSVPSGVFNAKSMTEINITANRVTSLPSDLSSTTLRILDADSNLIETIPASIGACTALERLNVVHNKLSTVPKEIGNCKALALLNVSANKITSLPVAELAGLPALMCLQFAHEQPTHNPDGTVGETNEKPLRMKKP